MLKRESDHVGRAIVDYVAGLSDHQAVELDRLLDGGPDTIVRGFVV